MYCFYYQLFINRLFAFCKTRYPLLPVIVFNQRKFGIGREYFFGAGRFLCPTGTRSAYVPELCARRFRSVRSGHKRRAAPRKHGAARSAESTGKVSRPYPYRRMP